MEIILLEHPWHVIRTAAPRRDATAEGQHVPPWPRFAAFPSGTLLCSASNAQVYPAIEVCNPVANGFRVAELPMPALEGDSAYGEGVELYERDVLLEVLKLSYPGRYPVGDSDAESEPSTYEVFFDELLNETLFLVRQVLKADLPRSPATYWSSILADLRAKTDSDPARHSLVVDLAKTLMEPLEHVTSHPKRMLKRIRDQQRVQLVQEIDTHCLIDLARRPGSTMPEKAGPKQRVMAVTRHENIDLLENRVARHCCELLRRAAGRYLHSHQRVGRSERKQQVEKLFRNSKRWPSKPTVSGVGRLLSPCRQPNYALLQNIHYSRIWDGYSKLVRNEELRDGLWRWPRRLWMDRVGVYVADTVLSWAERSRHAVCINTADRLVQASHRHECGAWLSSDIMPGPFIVGMSSAEAGTLHIIDGRHPGVIDAKFGETSLLCSDFLAFLVKGSVIRALPIYAIWPSPCEAPGLDKAWWERIVGDVLESIALFNRRAKHVVAVGALLVHGSWDASSRNGPWHTATRDDLTCWQTALRPDASSWPTDIADRYRPFDVLTGG